MKKEKATFAMGCFWQPDYIFSKVKGVLSVRVGYAGCKKGIENPSYEDVCSEKTGCAEAVEIEFDSEIVSYSELLHLFWEKHNPTTLNRQGLDVGSQYRSAIFYHSEKQKGEAEKSRKKWEKRLKDKSKKIVTEIIKAGKFFPAEEYHQKYLEKTGRACHIPEKVFE